MASREMCVKLFYDLFNLLSGEFVARYFSHRAL